MALFGFKWVRFFRPKSPFHIGKIGDSRILKLASFRNFMFFPLSLPGHANLRPLPAGRADTWRQAAPAFTPPPCHRRLHLSTSDIHTLKKRRVRMFFPPPAFTAVPLLATKKTARSR
jgi:hypothetical protein